jgi:hypothetical protein
MILEMDIGQLTENLTNVKQAEPPELSDGVRYLMDTVYYPLLWERPLTIGDIDFERFDHEEVRAFTSYINNNVLAKQEQAEAIYRLFSKYRPKAAARRAFF